MIKPNIKDFLGNLGSKKGARFSGNKIGGKKGFGFSGGPKGIRKKPANMKTSRLAKAGLFGNSSKMA